LQLARTASHQSCSTQRAQPAAHTTVVRLSRSDLNSDFSELQEALGVSVEEDLLRLALTHRSYAYESGGLPTNERLEFLGDSVLGLLITSELFHRYPEFEESQLSPLRAGVVNSRALADVARTIGIGKFLLIGRGEEVTGGRDKNSMLADSLEALFGAIYLQHGYEIAAKVILRLLEPTLKSALQLGTSLDSKTALQVLAAAKSMGVPTYEVEDFGPAHNKSFTAAALLGGVRYPEGSGKSKREAEQVAAKLAYEVITTLNS